MSLVATERALYNDMWQVESYANNSPGEHVVPLFLEMAQPEITRQLHWGEALIPYTTRVLDAGCGSGKGALALVQAGFRVELCDLTHAGLVEDAKGLPFHETALWDDVLGTTGPSDYVYCTDVLEHIPTALTMLVVHRLLRVAKVGVFLTISTTTDQYGAWVGTPLHKTVQSFVWWRDMLDTIAEVVEARDCLSFGAYYVRRRRAE